MDHAGLAKASTKYLHQRLLVVLVSPPLPGIITQHRRGPNNPNSKHHGIQGEGFNESDEKWHEKGEDEDDDSRRSSSSSSSGSEGDECWSDDDPDRESRRSVLMGISLQYLKEAIPCLSSIA